ncbi:protein PAL OF QUIRKY [Rutidosis leptorrhynchoides]|uniref:protein PAL OF QUIRKY n=1 Tax=Rutidosis leptorrhynchoides TaxID=125765 RepID=UPI003A9A3E87
MDPPTTATATATTEPQHSHSLPPLPTPKIRLMVSYGGHIVPRPQTKSLCYTGGETRIVSVDRRTTAANITSLTHHLSRTLFNNRPFTLKYQLPNEDLDSLISITTDEDLHNMLEEHDRCCSHTRIRFFLFPTRPESVGSVLLDPKSETWFSDALKSSMIINRGLSDGSGMMECLDGSNCEGSLMNSGDSGKGSGSVQESMVLETCSSFGSINSSVSASNINTVGVGNEDNGGSKIKLVPAASIESDNSARIYQDQQLHPESESIIYNPSSTVQMQRNLQVPGYQIPQISDQRLQQPVQYIQTASPHYIQYPTGPTLPISSYYPMYVPYQHQPNQPYPIYVMPVGPTDINGSLTRPPLHTNIPNSPVPYNEVVVPRSSHEPVAVVPSHSNAPVGPTANPIYENEYDNDLAYAQIYKSQPSVPVFPSSKFESMKTAESDSSTQSQIGTSQQ